MICKYYLEGRCKFGSSCQNEHRQPYGGNRNNNNSQRSDIYDRISYVPNTTTNKLYDERSVRADLTKDRPIYRYSVYGPAKEEPNLIDGTDYSPEELRLQYYIIMGTIGCDISYQNGVKDLENRTQTQIDSCLKDLRNSLSRFESQKQQQSSFESFGSGGNAFGQPQPPPQGFGVTQQNTFGNQASGFGATPTFGQNTIGFPETQQGFGINAMSGSGFGQNAAGGFGGVQTQTFGGFGQPAQPDPQQLYQQQMLQQQQQQQALFEQQFQQQQQQQTPQFMELQQQQQQPTLFETNIPQSTDWEMYQVPERPPPQR